MSPEIIGALAGGAFALVNFGTLRWIADRMEQASSAPDQKTKANMIRIVAWVDLIIFPLVGYFVGPIVAG